MILLLLHPVALQGQADSVITDPEAYAVYAAVFGARFGRSGRVPAYIALLESTRAVTSCPRGKLTPQWREVFESYERENAIQRTLLPGFDLGMPHVVVTFEEVKGLLQRAGNDGRTIRGGWSEAYASFPGGELFTVSAVGFNRDKTRAMVTVLYNCGASLDPPRINSDCGGFSTIPLEKVEGRWIHAAGSGAGCGGIR